MKWIENPWKLVITVLVAMALAAAALTWHSIKVLPRDIQQAGEESSENKNGP